jgi:hypothetical protein
MKTSRLGGSRIHRLPTVDEDHFSGRKPTDDVTFLQQIARPLEPASRSRALGWPAIALEPGAVLNRKPPVNDVPFDVARRKERHLIGPNISFDAPAYRCILCLEIADQFSLFADGNAPRGLNTAAHRALDGDIPRGGERSDNRDIGSDHRGDLSHLLLYGAGCGRIPLPDLTAPHARIGLKLVSRAKLRMRLSPLYSHRDPAINAFRRKQMAAVFGFIDLLSDQMSRTGRHSCSPPLDISGEFDESDGVQNSDIANECAEAVAIRINRRAHAAFIDQTQFRPYPLSRVPGQIADFIFGQRVLARNRFTLALWAMRLVRTRER